MAPTDVKMKNEKRTKKDGSWKKSKGDAQAVKKKRKWIPEHKVFQGNVKEGMFWSKPLRLSATETSL